VPSHDTFDQAHEARTVSDTNRLETIRGVSCHHTTLSQGVGGADGVDELLLFGLQVLAAHAGREREVGVVDA
jgi:hypothetical protein